MYISYHTKGSLCITNSLRSYIHSTDGCGGGIELIRCHEIIKSAGYVNTYELYVQ